VVRNHFIARLMVLVWAGMAVASSIARAEIIETPADEANSAVAPAVAPPTALPSETPIQPSVHSGRTKSHRAAHHQLNAEGQAPTEVEPGHSELPLLATTRVLAAPSPRAKVIKTLKGGTYVTVTGSTKDYLRIDTGSHVGYIGSSAVQLVRPAEHIFRLTSDSQVYAQPNRWGLVLAKVHQGHDVHVVGLALSYVKIQMKSGLQGFVPATALQ